VAGRQRGGHVERDHGAGGDVTCGGDPDDSPGRLARRRDGPCLGTQSEGSQMLRGGRGGDAVKRRWDAGYQARSRSTSPCGSRDGCRRIAEAVLKVTKVCDALLYASGPVAYGPVCINL